MAYKCGISRTLDCKARSQAQVENNHCLLADEASPEHAVIFEFSESAHPELPSTTNVEMTIQLISDAPHHLSTNLRDL